jgi:hypothetical protein
VDAGQVAGEGRQLRDPPIGLGELCLDQSQQPLPNRGAGLAVAGGEQVGDLVKLSPRCLAEAMNASRSTALSS